LDEFKARVEPPLIAHLDEEPLFFGEIVKSAQRRQGHTGGLVQVNMLTRLQGPPRPAEAFPWPGLNVDSLDAGGIQQSIGGINPAYTSVFSPAVSSLPHDRIRLMDARELYVESLQNQSGGVYYKLGCVSVGDAYLGDAKCFRHI
jgi:hypothetical protein